MARKAVREDKEKKIESKEKGRKGKSSVAEDESANGLYDELETARQEAADNYDRYLRASAELENVKKRAVKERADALNYGNEGLLRDILPIVDSLERALEQTSNANDFDAFVEGLQLIYEKLLASLQKHGVERIDALGTDFDPNFHEAMLQVESEEYDDNMVVEEFERGYLLNGRLLRPVKAAVSKKISKDDKE